MKYTRIQQLLECIKPHQRGAFVSRLIEILGMEHPLSKEAFEFMTDFPIIKNWKDNPAEYMLKVLMTCCDEFGVEIDAVTNGERSGNHVEAKRIWMYLCEGVMVNNFDTLAEFIQMDKSSIKYHISKTRQFLETNKKYRDRVKSIVSTLMAEGLSESAEFFINDINDITRAKNH